ncbi:uncharacterized protein CIMG_13050 [Coccidioides immitis RS]|uniref:Uncharacterized protein n=1 Tax=Coccidioides immitis (strain RS) TaxID=246410 RepID=A0A0D8JTC5_COCIM|nr:uncharacterized protein CIMG_13050 [Coccidioides immitis RS]KJF60552.1 hypothetical protein CIMG_13050 [Coccidioides immitis RS]
MDCPSLAAVHPCIYSCRTSASLVDDRCPRKSEQRGTLARDLPVILCTSPSRSYFRCFLRFSRRSSLSAIDPARLVLICSSALRSSRCRLLLACLLG